MILMHRTRNLITAIALTAALGGAGASAASAQTTVAATPKATTAAKKHATATAKRATKKHVAVKRTNKKTMKTAKKAV